MVFPKSNLPAGAVPWGREVQKRIEATDSKLASLAINDRSDTKQLQDSYRRLDQTVQGLQEADVAIIAATAAAQQAADDAQAAIDGLISLGEPGGLYDINADNINAGTLTGVTVQTAEGDTRKVLLSGDDIEFYDYASLEGTPQLIYGGHITSVNLNEYLGSALSVTGPGDTGMLIASNYTYLSSAGPNAGGSITIGQNPETIGVRIASSAASPDYAETEIVGNIRLNGNTLMPSGKTLTISGTLSAPNISSSTTFAGNLSTDGSLTRTALNTGASTTCTINGSGQFVRTTSSARYKQDIQPLEVDYDELLSLEPKRFRLKEEAETNPDARFYAGFIAEEIDQTSLKDFVGYSKQEDGSVIPESVYYAEMTAALLAAIKQQDTMIKELQAQVAELQSKVQ